jgi:hypothetical protein
MVKLSPPRSYIEIFLYLVKVVGQTSSKAIFQILLYFLWNMKNAVLWQLSVGKTISS